MPRTSKKNYSVCCLQYLKSLPLVNDSRVVVFLDLRYNGRRLIRWLLSDCSQHKLHAHSRTKTRQSHDRIAHCLDKKEKVRCTLADSVHVWGIMIDHIISVASACGTQTLRQNSNCGETRFNACFIPLCFADKFNNVVQELFNRYCPAEKYFCVKAIHCWICN